MAKHPESFKIKGDAKEFEAPRPNAESVSNARKVFYQKREMLRKLQLNLNGVTEIEETK